MFLKTNMAASVREAHDYQSFLTNNFFEKSTVCGRSIGAPSNIKNNCAIGNPLLCRPAVDYLNNSYKIILVGIPNCATLEYTPIFNYNQPLNKLRYLMNVPKPDDVYVMSESGTMFEIKGKFVTPLADWPTDPLAASPMMEMTAFNINSSEAKCMGFTFRAVYQKDYYIVFPRYCMSKT
ncbi:unnamed protein product [Soboliphyme baturini]|uniref:Peptidase S1 domain-containing protein n=1 Tax=Soboliphyme baturini TaxID=241478 RepID=A0A183J9B9_9BILA|nr:unnamed protein product [Soboliphyme baturini]